MALIIISGCSPLQDDERTQDLSIENSSASAEDPILKEILIDKEDTESEVEEAALEASGFCKDDLYTNYLIKSYETQAQNKGKNSKKLRNNALHFATDVLKGPTSSYFGSMPVVMNRDVQFWVRYFKTKGKNTFLKWVLRGESLRKIIQPILREEGVPEELYYLAMIESGFNNKAYSSARATGTWQFMRGTAKAFNLKVEYWVDERKDPAKSTRAAARYLKDLYTRFGDWYLAIAAYNAGPGKINQAIKRGRTRDYWSIAQTKYIRRETKQYVPKILAAITVTAELEKHGFKYQADPNEDLPTDYVLVDRPIMISELENKLNLPKNTLRVWNPELIKGITPPKNYWQSEEGYQLRIPANMTEEFQKIKPKLSLVEIKDIKMYKIKSGDTLSAIARKHNTSISQIKAYNPSMSARRLRIGKNIAIPVPAIVTTKPKEG